MLSAPQEFSELARLHGKGRDRPAELQLLRDRVATRGDRWSKPRNVVGEQLPAAPGTRAGSAPGPVGAEDALVPPVRSAPGPESARDADRRCAQEAHHDQQGDGEDRHLQPRDVEHLPQATVVTTAGHPSLGDREASTAPASLVAATVTGAADVGHQAAK